MGVWIGSSVIHLGDKNVPNALMFIDKYTQVSRILNPIVLCIAQLPELYKRESLKRLFDSQFGGVNKIIKDILCDFFKVMHCTVLYCTANKCPNAQMHKCTNAQMRKCTDAQMHKCANAQMHK